MPHLSVAEILAAASDAGSEEARAHLTACARCRALASAAEPPADTGRPTALECRRLEPRLRALVGGRIERGTDADLESHLLECADCQILAVCSSASDLPLQDVSSAAYMKEERIAEGGMGRLFRARDRRLGREVVIKELRDERMAHRFEQEARLTARLQHPAVVGVLEAGRWADGSPFYAMELVAGEPLDRKIARCRKLEDRLALLPAVITIAEALAYAHDKQIVHRDVKPQNVMIGDFGESVLIDWGLAKDLNAAGSNSDAEPPERSPVERASSDGLTMMGVGTPQYMPPEQAAGEPPTTRMDVYAIGATLYHLFAGRPPFEGADVQQVRAQVLAGPPPSLDAVAPHETPREINSIVAKAMARDPADRFANAKLLASELVRFQTGRLVRSHRYSFLDRSRHWWRRYRTRIRGRVAIAIGVTLGIAGIGSLGRIVYERNRAEKTAAALLVEQARQEFLQGSSTRALAYLDEAIRQGAQGATMRYLAAAAKRDVAALEVSHSVAGRIVEISPDGTRAVGNRDGTAIEWEWPGGATRTFPGRALSYAQHADQVLTLDGETLRIIDRASGATVRSFVVGADICFATVVEGDRVLVLARDGALRILTLDGTLVASIRVRPRTNPEAHRLSGDRRRLVLPEFGGRLIEVVDTATGDRVASIKAPAPVFDADFSPDGSLVVTGSADRTATVWDLGTAKPRLVLPGHAGIVTQVAFTPDGSRVVTVSDAAECRIWNATTGALIAAIDTGDRFTDLQVSPDGTSLATAQLGTVRLWSTSNGTRLASFEAPANEGAPGGSIGFDPRGDRLFLAGDTASHVWTTRRGRLRFQYEAAPDTSLTAPLPARSHVAIHTRAGRSYWKIDGGTLSRRFREIPNAWLPIDDDTILCATSNGVLSKTDAAGRVAWSLPLRASVDDGAVSADGKTIRLRTGQTISFIREDGRLLHSTTVPRSGNGTLLWTACEDASCVVAGHKEGTVALYESDGSVRPLKGLLADEMPGSNAFNVRVTEDGRHVLAYVLTSAIPLRAEIRRYDRATGALLGAPTETSSLSFDAWDGYFATVDGFTVDIRRIRDATRAAIVRAPNGALDVGFSRPDGSLLVTSGYDGVARVWNWRSGRLLEELGGHAPRVTFDTSSFGCCDNFTMLALEGDEHGARLWTRNESSTTLWDLGMDEDPEEIEAFVREHRVPWRVKQGRLVLPDEE